jgi:hypothetical protein
VGRGPRPPLTSDVLHRRALVHLLQQPARTPMERRPLDSVPRPYAEVQPLSRKSRKRPPPHLERSDLQTHHLVPPMICREGVHQAPDAHQRTLALNPTISPGRSFLPIHPPAAGAIEDRIRALKVPLLQRREKEWVRFRSYIQRVADPKVHASANGGEIGLVQPTAPPRPGDEPQQCGEEEKANIEHHWRELPIRI